MGIVKYPFGPAAYSAPAYAAAQDIDVDNMLTYIKLTGLTGATQVNLNPGSQLEVGAKVIIDVVQDATGRNVTAGDNVVAPDLTGVANDRDTIELTYNGSEFIGGAWAKVVDAA